jgi:hypothetical protein
MTAKANGDWGSAATWTPSGCTGGGHATPTTGDNVIITGYHVTCSNETCYVGTAPANNTTYDLTIAQGAGASGELEIGSGGTLFLTGNYKLNSSAGANPTSFGILKLDTGATFVHDNANGSVQYRGYGGASANWNNIIFGTQGDTCTFSANFGYSCPTKYIGVDVAGGYNPVLFAMGTLYDDITYQIYGTSLKSCGSSTIPCLDYGSNNNANGYANAGIIDVEDSVFDTTFSLDSAGSYNASALTRLTWARNRTINDLSGWVSAGATHLLGPVTPIASCNITGSFFNRILDAGTNNVMSGCNFTGDLFQNGMNNRATVTHPIGLWQHNINAFAAAGNTFGFTAVTGGFLNDIYYSAGANDSSWHGGPPFLDGTTFLSIGNLADQYPGPNEGHCGFEENSTAPNNGYVLDNLSIMGSGGGNSCEWIDFASVNAAPAGVLYMDHNGENGTGVLAWLGIAGHGILSYPTNAVIASIRANIGWSPAAGASNKMVGDLQQVGTTPNTLVNANSVIDWNDNYNGTNSTLFSGGHDANCNPSTFNGTPYEICSTTAAPGPHETTVDPKYIDTTRRLDTWASRVMGQAQNPTGVFQSFWQCSSIRACIDGAHAWIQQGYQPTNMALKGTAHDGYLIGVNGSLGTGYTPGTCTATIATVDPKDLGSVTPGSLGCTINSSGTPMITVTNPGAHYLISNPATVLIDDGHGHTSSGLTVKLTPMDIGPVPISIFASVAP